METGLFILTQDTHKGMEYYGDGEWYGAHSYSSDVATKFSHKDAIEKAEQMNKANGTDYVNVLPFDEDEF